MRAMLALILSSGLLAACGGGGSDAGGTAQVQLLAISSTNQQAVSRATATATTLLLGAGGGVAAQSASTNNTSALSITTAAATPISPSLTSMALYMAHKVAGTNELQRSVLAADRSGGTKRALAVASEESACSVSGTVTLSVTDADNNNAMSIGDTLVLAFNQCRETSNDVLNGSMAINLSQFSVAGNVLTSFQGTLSMQQLNVADGVRTAALNGSLGVTYTKSSATQVQLGLTVGAGGLTAVVSEVGSSDSVRLEQGFALNVTETTSTSVSFSEAILNGSFSTAAIGGRVQLETLAPVLQYETEAYPRAGTLRAVGNASALRLQALSATTVRIELDADLNGTYESSTDMPWATLLPE